MVCLILLSSTIKLQPTMLSNHKKTPATVPLLHFTKTQSKPVHKKSQSLLLSNRLTKSYFSLHDTSLTNRTLVPRQQLRNAVKQITKIKGATSKLLQRYHSQQEEVSGQFHNITQSYIPRISLRKGQTKELEVVKRARSTNLTRNATNKFKLLFRDSKARKTMSQRKIERIDRKISEISSHIRFLSQLKPKQQPIAIEQKVKPRGTVVELQRIRKLVRTLIRNISLYFSMYSHPKKVGDLLKSVDGYNQFVKHIFFLPNNEAKQISKEEDVLKYFWVYKDASTRPEYYGEEDLYLFNILQNYSLKMEKAYTDIKRNFVQFEKIKLDKLKQQIGKKLQINEKKLPFMGMPPSPSFDNYQSIQQAKELNKIADFVDNRKRHNQDRREASLASLESMGVRFNVEERSKELIVREKEKIMKNCVVKPKLGQPYN